MAELMCTAKKGGLHALCAALCLLGPLGCALPSKLVETNAPHPSYEPVMARPMMPEMALNGEPLPATGSLFDASLGRELFTDTKAFRVGDVVTVQLAEKTQAQTSSASSTSKNSDLSLAAPTFFGAQANASLSASANQGRNLSGSGNSSQSNQLSGELTASVTQVLPNGNLVVRGEKRMTINNSLEHLRISGIVRPQDVSPENMVPSTKIANAHVEYSSKGVMADAHRAGWASRFFFSPLWPL